MLNPESMRISYYLLLSNKIKPGYLICSKGACTCIHKSYKILKCIKPKWDISILLDFQTCGGGRKKRAIDETIIDSIQTQRQLVVVGIPFETGILYFVDEYDY